MQPHPLTHPRLRHLSATAKPWISMLSFLIIPATTLVYGQTVQDLTAAVLVRVPVSVVLVILTVDVQLQAETRSLANLAPRPPSELDLRREAQ